MTTDKPVIGITMGDPCGVGAEIVVKALADSQLAGAAHYVVFGVSEQLAYTADLIEVDFTPARMQHEDYHRMSADVVVLDFDEISQPAAMPRGPSRVGGQASMAFCESAIAASLAGDIDAMVTAPISKTSWQMAGIKRFPGHTELLAERCNVRNVAMMFVSPKLRVALATIHQALFDIRNTLTIGCVFNPIDLADQALKQWFGIEAPRIAIAGLNPHAGEDGRFGDEESRII